MPKKDPRSQGKSGEELVRFKYEQLRNAGVPADIAKSARKRNWDFIEQTIQLVKSGMTKNIEVPAYYQTSKTKARKAGKPQPKKKPAAKKKKAAAKKKPTKNKTPKGYKAPPEGKYYAKNHKTGKYFLKSYPKPREIKPPIGAEPTGECYPRVMVFYQQVVDSEGESISSRIKYLNKRSTTYLETEINGGRYGVGWMQQEGIFIGRVRSETAANKKEMESYLRQYDEWTVLYNDCPNPKKLMAVIAAIGKYVYEIDKKEDAIKTLISKTSEADPEVGKELEYLQ